MKIGVHGKKFSNENKEFIESILSRLISHPCSLHISSEFNKHLVDRSISISDSQVYNSGDAPDNLNMIITLGGDGTLLEAVTHVGDKGIPILGINTGRMGFLATTAKDKIDGAFADIFSGDYSFDERTLLDLDTKTSEFAPHNYALNDFAILKKDTSSMITVNVFINGELLNVYWADGIITSTATGSTGYSLSCGGPLIMPGSKSFVITPVSPHNLTARPMIVPDDSIISFTIEGRSKNHLISLDSRFATIGNNANLTIKKADFSIKLVKLKDSSYFRTIRQKLGWGIDIRN